MKSYRITVIELTPTDGTETLAAELFAQVVPEADFNLRAVISAVNSKPRTRNRKQTLVARGRDEVAVGVERRPQ
jgi:hypothetical protein